MLLLIVGGFLASYILLAHLYSEMDFEKFVPLILAMYFSITGVLGTLLSTMGLSWNYKYFLFAYIAISCVSYISLKKRRRENLSINFDPRHNVIYLLVIIVTTAYLIYPAYPDFYPIAYAEDAPRHFELTYYIQETENIPGSIDHPWTTAHVQKYPYGMHLNIAILSSSLRLPLIKFIFPFIGLILALTAMSIARMLKYTGEFTFFAAFLFVTSSVINNALSIFGSWSSLLGGFLAVTFILALKDYSKKFSLELLFFLILLESAIIITYPAWAVVCSLAFLIVLANIRYTNRFSHGLTFLISSLAITSHFWLPRIKGLSTTLGKEGGLILVENVPVALSAQEAPALLLGVLGITAVTSKEKTRLLPLLGATIVFPILAYFYSQLFSNVSTYYYYKTYFFLEYSIVAFAALGLWTISKYVNAHNLRYRLKPIFLILIAVLIAFQLVGLEESRFRGQSLTESDYRTAMWIKNNLPPDVRLSYLLDTSTNKGKYYWIGALSNTSFDWEETRNYIVIDNHIYSNIVESQEGDNRRYNILIIAGNKEVYEILYEDGDNQVLRLKGLE